MTVFLLVTSTLQCFLDKVNCYKLKKNIEKIITRLNFLVCIHDLDFYYCNGDLRLPGISRLRTLSVLFQSVYHHGLLSASFIIRKYFWIERLPRRENNIESKSVMGGSM